MSPQPGNASYSKSGEELAAALEQVADDQSLIDNPQNALEVLGITIPGEFVQYPPLDPDALRRAAEAIRAGCIPAFWPWIWWIPWISFRSPEGGGTTAT
jgi:hypothetical protein